MLTRTEQSLLLATYFRGMPPQQEVWSSCCDQVITLSLFYTGDITAEDCIERFSRRSYISNLYEESYELRDEIAVRYHELIALIRQNPEWIRGGGNLELPAYPTFTSCRLTSAGDALIPELITQFPPKPDFPHWPDKRSFPGCPNESQGDVNG